MQQPDLFAARERGKTGSRRAGERADRAVEEWTLHAALALRTFALWNEPRSFLVEEVSRPCPYPPPDPRAWGHATRLAVKRGWIKKVGYAPAESSNGSPKCLWAKA